MTKQSEALEHVAVVTLVVELCARAGHYLEVESGTVEELLAHEELLESVALAADLPRSSYVSLVSALVALVVTTSDPDTVVRWAAAEVELVAEDLD